MQRRAFLTGASYSLLGLLGACSARQGVLPRCDSIEVNDMQSQLNATTVCGISYPQDTSQVADLVREARARGKRISVCGGRHAMGGQQFGAGTVLVDTASCRSMLHFDRMRGHVTFGAGAQWPEILQQLDRVQEQSQEPWAIREKQSGVDRVSLGGTLGANAHGRGLTAPPMICDVESFVMVTADGQVRHCSRSENGELFRLAIGGYGLFGIMTEVTLRLTKRKKLIRRVEVIPITELLKKLEDRLAGGALYGDCQYAIDLARDPQSYPGILSTYAPASPHAVVSEENRVLTKEDWLALYRLTRSDKRKAFEVYSKHYLATDGQVYYSDLHQLTGTFFGAYREAVHGQKATEMLTELYVPREALVNFLADARTALIAANADVTYGTIRFIEEDKEAFLTYAKRRLACIVCNLHVTHSAHGIERAKRQFQALIDCAMRHGGHYYLTYHRWARRDQLLNCYPQFPEFLKLKKKYDAEGVLSSDWYSHCAALAA